MRKVFLGFFTLICLFLLVPTAFAAEDGSGTGTADGPWFKPTLRAGCAVDAAVTHYTLDTKNSALGGVRRIDLKRPANARFYLAAELPFAITDRLTLTLGTDWAFSGAEDEFPEVYNASPIIHRYWDRDGRSDWVTADFLISYALIKDMSVVKDLSVVAGLRWDYEDSSYGNPHNSSSIASLPVNTVDYKMQTLAPVFGLDCTFKGFESGIWGGDFTFGVLSGPVVWGRVDYRETFGIGPVFEFKNDVYRGYIVKVSGQAPLISGSITPGVDASLSLFVDYTRTAVHGVVEGTYYPFGLQSQYHFKTRSDVITFGLAGSLAFDIYGRPEPVSPPPAPAPVIEPKIEPMSRQ